MGLKSKAKFWIRQFPFIYPRIINSCQDWIDSQKTKKGIYFSQRGPWYKTIFAGSFSHLPEPKTLGLPNEKAFYNNRNYPTDKASLFYLPNSLLFGHKGLVLTANHQVFQEFSHHFGIASLKKFLRKKPFYTFTAGAEKIPGLGAVLVSPESHNYYHWLNDVLPRIRLYEPVLDQIDHFCVASNVPAKFLDILKDFGIPAEKILLVKEKEKLHFDHSYVASLPGSEGRSPQWAVDYIREKLLKNAAPIEPLKKLYFKRGENAGRKILNESAIIKILESNGFLIADPGTLSIREQIALIQQAKIVISAHGAALSNLLFSPDNLTVIELFSPDYFRTDCFYTLSSIMKLNYWYIAGERPADAAWGDIIIDEKLLINTIQQANG
jgi:capsular polysaccharide biosynthesis protein